MRIYTAVLVAVLCMMPLKAIAAPLGGAMLFRQIAPSIALVLTKEKAGSAFCINSTSTTADYLTNAHVVGAYRHVRVVRQYPVAEVMDGTVVARGDVDGVDLAVVRVSKGNVPALKFSSQLAVPGQSVAIAGYPKTQLQIAQYAGELSASIHTGSVSAVFNRGKDIEYDAISEPGNSGGPLLDASTGSVVGIVATKFNGPEANFAIGAREVAFVFLRANHLTFNIGSADSPAVAIAPATPTTMTPAPEVLKNLPGAGNIVVILPQTSDPEAQSIVQAAATDFVRKFNEKLLPANMQFVNAPSSALTKASDIGSIAREHDALLAIVYAPGWSLVSDRSNAYGISRTWDVSIRAFLYDAFGQPWADASARKNALSARALESAIVSSAADLNDKVLSGFNGQGLIGGSDRVRNLLRYALPMSGEDRRVFFSVSPDARGLRVSYIARFSSAQETGLQVGDVITAIDGVSAFGLDSPAFAERVDRQGPSGWVHMMTIISGDGSQRSISIESRDLRWYVAQRGNPG